MLLYQPTWSDGREHGKARRDANARYQAIANHLNNRHGFTVLDFGAYGGYFSARLTEQFGATCTAVDDSPHLTETPGVTVIRERLTPTQLRKLGPFDIALCLSVLHHIPQWRATLNALTSVASTLFIETAHPDETLPKAVAHGSSAAIQTAVQKAGGIQLCHTPGYDHKHQRPLWVIHQP